MNEHDIDVIARAVVPTGVGSRHGNDVTASATTGRAPTLAEYGEIAASRVFAQRHADQFRYVPEWNGWLFWDGTRWQRDVTGRARLAAKELCDRNADASRHDPVFGPSSSTRERAAQKLQSKRYVDAVLDLAKVEPLVVVRSGALDANAYLINTPSGTVDLRSGTLRAHQRGDYLTLCTAVAPRPGARPAFDRFMHGITCGDAALGDYLQRALGACLSGAISDHWLLFWYGSGANGKNTLGDLVLRILADYAKAVPTQTLMADSHGNRHPTEVANLRGLRLAISSEISEGEHWNEARLKELTGDAVLTGRFMRQDFFEFPRTHKHVVYGNHRPLLRIVDPAIGRRLHMVPFNATFTIENGALDPSMPAKLWEEAPQVLAWLIEGHEKWREEGTLRRCRAVEQCTSEYLESQASLDQWIEERLDTVPDDGRGGRGWQKSSELYRDFSDWKKDRGEQPFSQTRWSEQMQRRFQFVSAAGRRIVGAVLKPRVS